MLKTFLSSILFCFAVIIITNPAIAQTTVDSSAHAPAMYANAEDNFYNAVGPQSRLYSGMAYDFYDPIIKGNAYVLDNASWNLGSVMYDGYLYKNVSMLYDIYKDLLVIQLYHSALKMALLKSKVKSFDLLNHHFIYIEEDPANTTSVNTGYYDQLYGGSIEVLAYRAKSIQTSTGFGGTIDSYFSPSIDYYLYKDGKYYPVSSQGSFLKVLKDRKKELQQYIRGNKIKFRQQKEQAMVKIAAYYDHLTN